MSQRSTIRQLSSHVVSLIAAGEVAERPSGIIKELIENSLDANATQIEIHLEKAGTQKISVADNGHGILPDDLPLSVLPHATSKIYTPRDLESIRSLGFRGEALASISKAGNCTIISRHESSDSAYRYHHNTQQVKASSTGMAVGTVVEIKELFADIPARKKYLQKPSTELKHSIDIVSAIALSHPSVEFKMYHDGKHILHLPAKQSLMDRFLQLTDWNMVDSLIPISYQDDIISVTGFSSAPTHTKSHTQDQWLSINSRPIIEPKLTRIVKTGYGASIPSERNPLFVLQVEMDPSLFDINRHPKKNTVAFMDEELVYKLITNAINQSFSVLIGDATNNPETHFIQPSEYDPANTQTLILKDSHRGHFPAEKGISRALKTFLQPWRKYSPAATPTNEILQIDNTYLVTEHDGSLILVDQHAAHERILYEQFRRAYHDQQTTGKLQDLQPPLTLNLTTKQTLLVQDSLDLLKKIGFCAHFVGDQSITVTSVPSMIPIEDTKRILFDVIDDIAEGSPVSLVDDVAHRTIAYVACRSAVMAGDPLDTSERSNIITTLFSSPNFQTCPHGRPTFIKYDTDALEKLFKRK